VSIPRALIAPTVWKERSEIPLPSLDVAVPRPSGTSVYLAEIVRARVDLEWFEAVAIAHGLCRSILDSGDLIEPQLIDLHNVFIDAAGSVGVELGPRSALSPVQSVGAVLSALLPQTAVMFLRDGIVAKATASPPAYRSLDALSDALPYSERPNRTALIQAVYERWIHRSLYVERSQAGTPVLLPEPALELPQRRVSIHPRVVRLVVGAAVLVAAAATAATFVINRIQWTADAVPGRAVVERIVRSLTGTERAPADALTDSNPPTPSRGRRRARSAETVSTFFQNVNTPDGSPAFAAPEVLASATTGQLEPLETAGILSSGSPSHSADLITAALDTRIYGRQDADVGPPVPIYPQSLTPAPDGLRRPGYLALEVIVNDRGTVDTARARDLPRTVGESVFMTMALSAVKSWQFHPARKDGSAVTYREIVAIETY
jgi:hypothetical protein